MLNVYIFQTFWIHSLLFHSALYPRRLTFTQSVDELALCLSLASFWFVSEQWQIRGWEEKEEKEVAEFKAFVPFRPRLWAPG